MKFLLSLAFFLLVYGYVNAQITLYPTVRDTGYFKAKQNGQLKAVQPLTADVKIITYSENGIVFERKRINNRSNQLREHTFYIEGKPSGKWLYYNEEGALVRERNFGKLIYGNCDSIEDPDEDIVLPKFGFGEKELKRYLKDNLKYPAITKAAGIFGIVKISFVVDEVGKAHVSYICGRGLDAYSDLAVWELVDNMPLWKPGTKDGKAVEVNYILPVEFSIW